MGNGSEISAQNKKRLPVWELVTLLAALMAMNAMAVDIMLPAYGDISEYYNLLKPNDRQKVLYAYILGFGAPQLIFGPLSDRFGRVGLLKICLIGYIITGLLCMKAESFGLLLGLRFTQGVVSSGLRVIAVSIVRDMTSGRKMARIMSLIMTIFMIVPILAPLFGQGIMAIAHWKWTFGVLGLYGIIVLIWSHFRLPETLPPEKRQPLSFKRSLMIYFSVLKTRETFGYMLASAVIFGALFAYLGAADQIFEDVFHVGEQFGIWFAVGAGALAVANLINAKIVERYGMRRISHIALFAFLIFSLFNILTMTLFGEKLIWFIPLISLTFACFGMMGANFSAIAMEAQGEFAATASAAYGFATTTIAGGLGFLVAAQFNGSIIPIMWGFVVLSAVSILIVFITEKGRLFDTHPDR